MRETGGAYLEAIRLLKLQALRVVRSCKVFKLTYTRNRQDDSNTIRLLKLQALRVARYSCKVCKLTFTGSGQDTSNTMRLQRLQALTELTRIVSWLVHVVGHFFHWSKSCVDCSGVHLFLVGFLKRLVVASLAPLCLALRFQPLHSTGALRTFTRRRLFFPGLCFGLPH